MHQALAEPSLEQEKSSEVKKRTVETLYIPFRLMISLILRFFYLKHIKLSTSILSSKIFLMAKIKKVIGLFSLHSF
jgi:hypothetical protein